MKEPAPGAEELSSPTAVDSDTARTANLFTSDSATGSNSAATISESK